MSERERWIVYPLLFLALGAALRDKLVDRTLSRDIVCQRLTIVGDDRGGQPPQPLIELGAAKRASTAQPQRGLVQIDGQLRVQSIETSALSSNNYYYRHIPFAPNLLRVMPNPSPPAPPSASTPSPGDAQEDANESAQTGAAQSLE